MSHRKPLQAETPDLRCRAEVMLGKMIEKVVPSLAPENVEALVHELRVHQIELQMQCEELRRARQEAGEGREQYHQLYETAPGAYISLDTHLKIEQINVAGSGCWGWSGQLWSASDSPPSWGKEGGVEFLHSCRQVFSSGGQVTCETSVKSGDQLRTVLIEICAIGSHEDDRHLRLAATDITERKQAEDRLKEQSGTLARSEKSCRR